MKRFVIIVLIAVSAAASGQQQPPPQLGRLVPSHHSLHQLDQFLRAVADVSLEDGLNFPAAGNPLRGTPARNPSAR